MSGFTYFHGVLLRSMSCAAVYQAVAGNTMRCTKQRGGLDTTSLRHAWKSWIGKALSRQTWSKMSARYKISGNFKTTNKPKMRYYPKPSNFNCIHVVCVHRRGMISGPVSLNHPSLDLTVYQTPLLQVSSSAWVSMPLNNRLLQLLNAIVPLFCTMLFST